MTKEVKELTADLMINDLREGIKKVMDREDSLALLKEIHAEIRSLIQSYAPPKPSPRRSNSAKLNCPYCKSVIKISVSKP